jgi:hypothetical protein
MRSNRVLCRTEQDLPPIISGSRRDSHSESVSDYRSGKVWLPSLKPRLSRHASPQLSAGISRRHVAAAAQAIQGSAHGVPSDDRC